MLSVTAGALTFASSYHALNAFLWLSCATNGLISLLIYLQRGQLILGKNLETGKIPWWSYAIFFNYYIPTYTMTILLHLFELGPVATEVYPGYYIGGSFSYRLEKSWGVVVDLTCEWSEGVKQRESYVSLPLWDGTPPNADQIEEIVGKTLEAKKTCDGDILVHCAHGRGRSACLMVALLVKARLFKNYKDAFSHCVKERSCISLSKGKIEVLDAWEEKFNKVDESPVNEEL